MRDSRLEQSQMYYKNVLAKKITEDVNFVPAYEEAMEKIEAKIPKSSFLCDKYSFEL